MIKNYKKTIFILTIILFIFLSFFGGGKNIFTKNIFLIFAGACLLIINFNHKIKLENYYYYLFGFLLFSLASLFFSKCFYDSSSFLLYIFSGLIFFYLGSSIKFSKKQKDILILIVLIVTLILCLIGFYFYLTGYYNRLTSLFYWPNSFAGYLLLVLPLTLLIFLKSDKKFLIVPFLIILFTSFILTGSRGAFLSFLFVLPFIFLYKKKFFSKSNLIWLGVALLLIISFTSFLFFLKANLINEPNFLAREKEESSSLGVSNKIRLNYWQAGLKIFKEKPVLGIGFNNFSKVYPSFQRSPLNVGKNPHNFYLKLLSEGGVFVFFFFILFLITIFLNIFKREKLKEDNYILGFGLGALGIALHSFIDIDWEWSVNFFLFCLFLGFFSQEFKRTKTIENNKERITKIVIILISITLIFSGIHRIYVNQFFNKATQEKNLEEQEKLLKKSLFLNSNPEVKRLLISNFLKRGDYYEAGSLVDDLLKKDPLNSINYYLAGEIEYQKNNYKEAEKFLKIAIEKDSMNYPIFYLKLSKIYSLQEKKEERNNLIDEFFRLYSSEVIENRRGFILYEGQEVNTSLDNIILELKRIRKL